MYIEKRYRTMMKELYEYKSTLPFKMSEEEKKKMIDLKALEIYNKKLNKKL